MLWPKAESPFKSQTFTTKQPTYYVLQEAKSHTRNLEGCDLFLSLHVTTERQ